MNITAAQIEDIVRVVLQRLQSDAATPQIVPALPSQKMDLQGEAKQDFQSAVPGELRLTDRVITLDTLKGRWSGTQSVVIHPKAVVTPATLDELRTRNIRLVRQLPQSNLASRRKAPLLLVTTQSQLNLLGKRVCSQQAESLASDEIDTGLAAVSSHLAASGSGVVWCTETPFAAVAATYGKTWRTVQLLDQRDLAPALQQAEPNVIVVDRRTWTEPAIANLIRNWYRSLR